MNSDDLPMISLSSDSTQVELTPQKEAKVGASEPTRPPVRPAGAPAPSAAPSDPRKASEARKPGSIAPAPAPARSANDPSASRPAAPSVRPAPAPVPSSSSSEDEDSEKLLREYADRQKTKLVRLEQQLVEYKKIVGERDALKAKVDALGKELQDARRQLDASAKSEEVIKDLQGKVDAAILSNSILSEDKEKLKKALSQQTEHLKKAEERCAQTEKSLAEVEKKLIEETDSREAAESKVSAALAALQSEEAPAPKAAPERAVSEAPTRPMPSPPAPAAKAPVEEKPGPARPPAGKPATAPGRFSFLKK
ncbi:MAG TPA: hypothetical protein VKW04_21980 [Planctomycetota bacterium]|nr:hypothetical protein [Planctomycetota bacterium]